VPTPIVSGDLIYFTSAHGRMRPMRAIRVDATGDLTPDESGALKPGVAWNHDRRGNYMQTPLATGGLVFGCADTGLLTCFDAKTGEVKFSEKLSPASEGYTASPVSDGRNLFFTSELGNVFVVPAAATFAVAAKNELGETCLSTPAIAGGALFFRTRGHLVAVGAK
jgi:outer membrane protein assembly factor BamB